MKARSEKKQIKKEKYMAGRRMIISGVVYNPGDTSDLETLSQEYLAHLIARQFWGPVDGLESLDEELFLLVMEMQD